MFKKLVLFICFIENIYIWGCIQFPLTKTLRSIEILPSSYKALHNFLAHRVVISQKKHKERNAFSCAISFLTDKGKTVILCIDTIVPIEIKPPLNFSERLEHRVMTEVAGLPETVSKGAENLKSKIRGPKKSPTVFAPCNISKHVFEEGCFLSANQLPLFVLQEEELNCTQSLLTNVKVCTQESKNILQKLFFDYILTVISRSQPIQTTTGVKNGDLAHYCMYNSDSELHALYVLQHIVDDIAVKIANIVTEGEKIVKIEFHGCTTRDMCPLCYTNMNCMQFLANQKQGVGFLGALLERLNMMGYGDASINSATFISSLEKFPSSGNLLWDIDESVSAIEPGFVYQFRFTEPEITAIKDLSEEILKRAADITDLSSLSVSPEEESTSAAAKPFTVSSEIGTPPHSTERPETIPAKLKEELATARYRIQDVPGDGNCAFYAYALSVGIKASSSELREAAYSALENFRKNRQEDEDEKEVMDELAKRLQKDKEWVGVDDLKWLGQSQTRDIIIIQPNYDNPEQIFIHNPIAQNENPLAVELPIKQLSIYIKQHNGSVFLYYNGVNHFQAIVPQ